MKNNFTHNDVLNEVFNMFNNTPEWKEIVAGKSIEWI